MKPGRKLLIATGAALLWAPPVAAGSGERELRAQPPLTTGPDLLTAVLAVGLAVVAAVAAASFLMLWAARRRDDEMRKDAEPIEVVGHRARSRAELRMSDDPIMAGMGLGRRQRPRGRKS
jgi:hypothetical protein